MSKRNNLLDLINRANKVHNNKYDYSLIENYNSMHDYQKIICPTHGVFEVPLHWHINKGRGCKQCAIDSVTYSREDFIKNARRVHGETYNYDKVVYITGRKKVIITCPKHGDFQQQPRDHVNAQQGCPACKESKGEKEIANILQSLNLEYEYQKKFEDLKYRSYLYFDFYLPSLNRCIEFDGEQHFRPVLGWGDEKMFKDLQRRDRMKNSYCNKKSIPLLRLTFRDFDNKLIQEKLYEFIHLGLRVGTGYPLLVN